MSILVDTSILARLANSADAFHGTADRAVARLHLRGEVLQVTAQNLIEFRNVATRPVGVNGLGLSPADVEAKVSTFESIFLLLPEIPDVYPAWKSLVEGLGVIGKQVHDARLVAVCHVYEVTHVLTFNTGHFARLSGYGPGIVVVDPASV